MNKKALSESDICDKFIRPAMEQAGWDGMVQIYGQFPLRAGRVVVRGRRAKRDASTVLRADYALFFKPNIPLAVVEAKDNHHAMGAGIAQARVANVQRWKLALDSMKDIVIDETELARYQLAEGDLLITEGGDWDKVGRTAIWRSELPGCLHQNHVFKARGYTTTWNPGWAELYLNLDVARAYFAASAKQTTNLASINMTELRHCVFPLPPLSEQARIIARVNELRRLCAALRQRLTASQTTQSHLAEALVDTVGA